MLPKLRVSRADRRNCRKIEILFPEVVERTQLFHKSVINNSKIQNLYRMYAGITIPE